MKALLVRKLDSLSLGDWAKALPIALSACPNAQSWRSTTLDLVCQLGRSQSNSEEGLTVDQPETSYFSLPQMEKIELDLSLINTDSIK